MAKLAAFDGSLRAVEIQKPGRTPRTKYLPFAVVTDDRGRYGIGIGAVSSVPFDLFAGPVAEMVTDALKPVDLGDVRACWQALGDSKLSRLGDLGARVRAVVDIALWDMAARNAEAPLHRLLGTHKGDDGVWTYVTIGDPDWSEAELVRTAQECVEAGATGLKVKVGRAEPSEDADRIRAVRLEVGEDVRLMADATELWTRRQAVEFSLRVHDSRLMWLEEPCPMGDLAAYRHLARESVVPIALGESLTTSSGFRDFLVAETVDVLQPDVTQVGGITPWLSIAGLAEGFGIPLVPHHSECGQVHQHLVFATPGAVALEFPWKVSVFDDPVRMRAGHVVAPVTPGAGTALRDVDVSAAARVAP